MSTRTATMAAISLVFAVHSHVASASEPSTPEVIVASFDQRVEKMFRAESGKPLVRAKKEKPLGPGRGNYVRAYSYSMLGFAARCFHLGEMVPEANAVINPFFPALRSSQSAVSGASREKQIPAI